MLDKWLKWLNPPTKTIKQFVCYCFIKQHVWAVHDLVSLWLSYTKGLVKFRQLKAIKASLYFSLCFQEIIVFIPAVQDQPFYQFSSVFWETVNTCILCHLSCTVTCTQVSNCVWVYTNALQMEKAGKWVRGATCLLLHHVERRFFTGKRERSYNSAFSYSFIFQLSFHVARPQQMLSKHTDYHFCKTMFLYVVNTEYNLPKSEAKPFWKCVIFLIRLCCKCIMSRAINCVSWQKVKIVLTN